MLIRILFSLCMLLFTAACVADGSQPAPAVSGQATNSNKPKNCGYITSELPSGAQRLSSSSTSDQKFAIFLGYREGSWTDGRGLNLCTTLDVQSVTDNGDVNAVYCNGADADRGYSLTCLRVPGKIVGNKLTVYPYDGRPFTYEYRSDGSLQGSFASGQSGRIRTATLKPR